VNDRGVDARRATRRVQANVGTDEARENHHEIGPFGKRRIDLAMRAADAEFLTRGPKCNDRLHGRRLPQPRPVGRQPRRVGVAPSDESLSTDARSKSVR
jgi:hypothetical protein